MTDTVRLGRILGIPIGANWSIVGVAALLTVSLAFQSLPLYAPETGTGVRVGAASIAVAALFASILAHELGHAVVAMNHGVGVSGISLWLLGGVARLDRQAPTPRAEARIAAAGPAVSFILALFFASVAIVAAGLGAGRLLMAVLSWLAGVNALLAVFNLAPAAPLDGGRVLAAALWHRSGDPERSRVIAGRCGLVLSAILVVGGLVQVIALGQYGGWVTILVGGFTLTAAREEIATAVIRGRLSALSASAVMAQRPEPIPDTVTIQQLDARFTGPQAGVAHPVVRWGSEPIGWIVPGAQRDIPVPDRSWTQAHQVMRHRELVHQVLADRQMSELIDRWNGTGMQILVVNDERGTPVGTISDAQVQPLIQRPDWWGRDRRPNDGSPRWATPGPGLAPAPTTTVTRLGTQPVPDRPPLAPPTA